MFYNIFCCFFVLINIYRRIMGILEGVTSQDKAHHSTGVEEKDSYLTKSKTIFIELYIPEE